MFYKNSLVISERKLFFSNDENKHPFEFELKINKSMICKRNFAIYDYKNELDSLFHLRELIYELVVLIESNLKSKTIDLLWKSYNPYQDKKNFLIVHQKEDTFKIIIRYNSRELISSVFDASFYPPKVRYQVDMKMILPIIINKIRRYLS